ncbi:MAG: EAL domain-containing protein [Gammaproteobacteria bacterium]|nr:EAL domain-containing protein [Gammaproteobacteria bacterium]
MIEISTTWLAFSSLLIIVLIVLLFASVRLLLGAQYERQNAEARIHQQRELAEVTLDSIGEAVITTDTEHNITYMNPVACQLTGWTADEALHLPLEQVVVIVSEADHAEVDSTIFDCLNQECLIEYSEPMLLIGAHGNEYSIETSASPLKDRHGDIIGAVLVFINTSHIRNLSRELEFQASHDSLTSLLNRREFERQLAQAIRSANEDNRKHALCYLDLDQFKIVNDTCGHMAGDQLLRELSRLMPHSIRASDCLARLGGDEFGIIIFNCSIKDAIAIADSLRTAIKNFTFTWNKKVFDIGVSIGVVAITKDSGTLQDILRRADASCYIAKDLGRNRIHIYAEDDVEIEKRHGEIQWLTRIQDALKEDRFRLATQKITAIKNGLTPHYEVLLRMLGKEGEIIAPLAFLPAAERYEMMPVIDRWIISTTFKNIRRESADDRKIYNINLSGQTLCDNSIVKFIRDQLNHFKIPPDIICFEITETVVISNLGVAIELVNKIKAMGCMFALDDFGCGLSSFSYLKSLPVDYLKIDGEFIQNMVTDSTDRAIVVAINDIGHEMGLKTVAEYVESKAIFDLLGDINVDYAQGHFIKKPKLWCFDDEQNIKSIS